MVTRLLWHAARHLPSAYQGRRELCNVSGLTDWSHITSPSAAAARQHSAHPATRGQAQTARTPAILTSSRTSSHAPAVVQNKRNPAATQGEQRPAGMYQGLCASTRARGWSAKSSQPHARLPPCRSQQAVAAHHARQALACLELPEARPAQLQACILNHGGNTRHHAEPCLQHIMPCPFGYFPAAAGRMHCPHSRCCRPAAGGWARRAQSERPTPPHSAVKLATRQCSRHTCIGTQG